jgi:hypothetical protein
MLAIEFEQGIEEAWSNIATFVPKLLGFLVILLIGYFIAKVLARVADSLLERIGFDGWVERGTLGEAFQRSKFDPSDMVGMVVFWGVFLIALQLAFGVFGPNPISDLLDGVISYLPNVIVAVIILVITAAIAKVVTDLLSGTLGSVSGGQWIARGAGMAILVIGIFATLDQLQIAPAIVQGLFYALLIAIVGSTIVAVGGGGIRTMQRYWERAAGRLEGKAQEIKENADPDAGRTRLEQKIQQERDRMEGATTAGTSGSGTIDLTEPEMTTTGPTSGPTSGTTPQPRPDVDRPGTS